MDKLRAQVKRVQAAPPDEQLLHLQKEATAVMNDALGAVRGGLRQALLALNDVPEGHAQPGGACSSYSTARSPLTWLRCARNSTCPTYPTPPTLPWPPSGAVGPVTPQPRKPFVYVAQPRDRQPPGSAPGRAGRAAQWQAAIYAAACAELGMSTATLYRHLGKITVKPERKQRSDAGDVSLSRDEAVAISAVLMTSHRKTNKRLMSIGQASDARQW